MCGLSAEAQEKRPTAGEVVAAIQEHVFGVPWKTETVDTFKGRKSRDARTGNRGDDDGDAGRAAAGGSEGAKLIITHEPTFYNHLTGRKEWMRTTQCGKRSGAFIEEKRAGEFGDSRSYGTCRNPDGILAEC